MSGFGKSEQYGASVCGIYEQDGTSVCQGVTAP